MPEESYIQQLANYVKKNLAKGYTLDSLRIALERQDYSKTAIERAIKLANEQLATKAPIMKEKPKITHKIITDKELKKEIKDDSGKEKGFLKKLME